MALRKTVGISAAVLAAVLATGYMNRLHLLQYSLGWYTDIRHPRGEYRPAPWMAGPASADQSVAQRPPNIIIIMADDLGINDVSSHGGGYTAQGAPTPAIDSIARDGVRFDNRYAGAAVSTVSRAALIRQPPRIGGTLI